jgi:hypothetical protein
MTSRRSDSKPRHTDPSYEGPVWDEETGYRWQWARLAPMIPVRVRALAFAVPALLGGLAYWALSDKGGRAALSFVAGVALAGLLLVGGMLAVRAAAALSPLIATVMALSTYATVTFVLAAVLAFSDPHVLDAPAFALGLVVGVVVGITLQVRDARPGHRL